jgi:hypothetical protein
VTGLTVSAASGFEGDSLTFTAALFNNGTDIATDLPVYFSQLMLLGIYTSIGSVNVTVAKGASANAVFVWKLPNITAASENETIRAGVGGFLLTSWQTINITVNKKLPKIEFSSFVIPANIRRYDDVKFNLTVKNTGLANATGVVIKITKDGGIYCTTDPFNLGINETKTIQAEVTIMDAGDANHVYIATATAGGADFSKNATVYVLHNIYPIISVVSLKMSPSKLENKPKDSSQSVKATVTLKNAGEKEGTVLLTLMDATAKKVVKMENVTVPANTTSKQFTYSFSIKGAGTHKIGVLVTGVGVDMLNATKEAKCELQYQPGFETVVLVGAVLVAIILLRRKKN